MRIYHYKIEFNGGFFWLITKIKLIDRSPMRAVVRRQA